MSDDNKIKLLKIQHALLEALAEKKIHAETDEIRNQITNELNLSLLKYKELVTEIEHGIYLELKDKINRLSDVKLTLEEELNKLEEIETFYNRLLEIQTRFKQTYALYSQDDLILSDISSLNLQLYLKRKEAIKAYLINKKNISDIKIQIEKINDELINEEQKETRINKKITFLDDEIIRRLLSSEGRLLVYENNQETLKYTSISSEYQNIGITIDRDGYQGTTLEELTAIANETKEKITAATISYEVLPNIENKKILDEIRLENITANYHLVLVKVLTEVYTPSKSCDEAIQKRERIKDLLKYRQTYLNSLGIKYGVDPFARLHINEQIEELRQHENNSRIIAKLRRELATLNARIETLEANNIEYSTMLEESQNAINNRHNIIIQPKSLGPSFNDFTSNIKPAEVRILDNQVISVSNPNPNFNFKKCGEITRNVIKKVYEIMTHPEINVPTESAPELVIEPSVIQEKKSEAEQHTSELLDFSGNIFSKIEPFAEKQISDPINQIPEIIVPQEWMPDLTIEPAIQKNKIENQETIVPAIPEEIFSAPVVPVIEQKAALNNKRTPEVTINAPEQVISQEWSPELTIEPKITVPQEPTTVVDNSQLFPEKVQPIISDSSMQTVTMPEISMPDLLEPTEEHQTPTDIFSDIVPFESPTMFTEKVDSIEPEKTISPIKISIEQSPENTTNIEDMKIKLEGNQESANVVDFWSTDADVNNIVNQVSAENEKIKLHRKGV